MRKYTFIVNTTVSLAVDIEADSLADAVKKAQCAPTQSFCHQCSRSEPGEWHLGGEVDSSVVAEPLIDAYEDGEPLVVSTIDW